MSLFFVAKANKFPQLCLDAHNEYRKAHGVPNLELSNELQINAQIHAKKIAVTDKIVPSGEPFGENIYTSPGMEVNARAAVKYFYDDQQGYDYKHEPTSNNARNTRFTQVIWKSTKRLGCAYAQNGNFVYVVAMYDPRGNIIGRFKENVFPSVDDSSSVSPSKRDQVEEKKAKSYQGKKQATTGEAYHSPEGDITHNKTKQPRDLPLPFLHSGTIQRSFCSLTVIHFCVVFILFGYKTISFIHFFDTF